VTSVLAGCILFGYPRNFEHEAESPQTLNYVGEAGQ
jgi:hypothetical protein